MWKKIVFLIPALLLLACSSPSSISSRHQQELLSKYPYALLGDDHEILTLDDLAINACEATPMPFSEQSTSYLYWQCFEVSKAKLFCDGAGYDEDEKMQLTVMVVSGAREGGIHEYITRRAIPLAFCRAFVRDWKNLVLGEKIVCVSGLFTKRYRNKSGDLVSHWVFDRFKTKRGCESFFDGGCSFQYQLDQGCKEGVTQ